MTRMKRSAGFSVAVLFLSIGASVAQDLKSEVSVEVMAAIPRNSDTRDVQYRSSKSGGLLASYRYHLNSWLAVQGEYGYSRAMHRFSNILGETDIQANLHQLIGEAVFTARTSKRARPYG